MINFDYIKENKVRLKAEYYNARPFPHLVLKNVCDDLKLRELYNSIPLLESKSRDYIFAANKFEKSNYQVLGDLFKEIQEDLRSEEMNDFLSFLSNKKTFVDPANHGGGLHQGRENSFLDMHLDYNYHPMHPNWWREMNLLLYLNKDWNPDYGGQLKLRDLRTDERTEIEIGFNTLVIQQCTDFSLHGYDQTRFPKGVFRTSIATYAFTEHARQIYKPRTTDWKPEQQGTSSFKKFLGRNISQIVRVKSYFLGSGTSKNQ
jgi:hypothetical protein